MIPILAVPVLNRPDLLVKMVQSLDVEIGEIIVIDNGGVVDPDELDRPVRLIRPGHNLGVAASWNLVIKVSPLAPWWCIVNNDIEFAPGDLDSLTTQIEGEPTAFAFLGTPSVFGLTSQVLDAVGFFDENFIPAYFEDNDFARRAMLAGVKSIGLPPRYHHEVSATIRSDAALREHNAFTFPENGGYYDKKWGGPPGGERFTTPFDTGRDVREWRLSAERLRVQTWPR